ncbi:MAG: alkaline phosphatase family protein [Acidimicrobiales bacterium]
MPIKHVVEIMLENHTFDSLFGSLRHADGVPAGTTLVNPDNSFGSAPRVAPIVAGPNQGSVGGALDNGHAAEQAAMDRRANGRFAMDGYTQVPGDGLGRAVVEDLLRRAALAAGGLHLGPLPAAGHAGGLVGADQFVSAAAKGTLPSFSFVRPGFGYSQESPEDLSQGDAWLGQLVKAVMTGADWPSTAVFVTYDEGGGFWDHVSPRQVDPAGYGTRTPMVVISPYTRPGLISQTTTNLSVLSFAQHLWGLAPLDQANALGPDLLGDFDFAMPRKLRSCPRSPRPPPCEWPREPATRVGTECGRHRLNFSPLLGS